MQGIIKKIMKDKYFGFITPAEGDKDLFFHANELDGVSFEELNEGDNVTFEINETPKGPAATNVKKA
jgi:cold shock protein